MGKTLAKQRKKAAKQAEEGQNGGPAAGGVLTAIAKRLKYKLPNLANAKKKVKLVPIISEAMNARAWEDAAQLLDMLEKQQSAGQAEVPKLGAIMRWVRAADLAGTEATAAKLLAGIMRVASGPQPAATAAGGAGTGKGDGNGGEPSTSGQDAADGAATGGGAIPVRRFPPWRPPPAAGSGADGEAAGSSTSASTSAVTSNGATPNARTLASIAAARAKFGSYKGRFGVVPLPAEYAGTNANGSTMTNAAAAAAAAAASATAQDGDRGAATLLPNVAKDLTMFCTEPDTVKWEEGRPAATRVEVPFVNGAFVLVDALSREECAQLMACAEEMGYTVDPDYTFSAAARAAAAGSGLSGPSSSSAARNGGSGGGERGAAGCVWLADESLQGPLYGRISHLLPQRLCGGDLAGINCRWRLYRYDKGAVYRPHVDGAWPGSGLKDGRLTFLVYLNDDFEGGATTFYTPARPGSGACLEAHSVRPVAGNILVFPHGDTMGSLVHEGAAVTQGAKYVIRTEVLYKLDKSANGSFVGAPQPAIQLPATKGVQPRRAQK
ncbi:hypothetical protein HYH02_005007 [Chlamydomonas schloesseri]|uniref:Fe2OG dioxygenase domain-containing protein n=1 Tax=Chlamydomonas schloesseri TaxID=2026947 RepID=A0A835WN44_9CHLO|nr:hypothetical protein HYH02_005007 [Chlamydomonas schloesseri]|eukprot:KAG2450506.1 hypothetical protein HYH02_005007 [Chlamydomonas schloesseri]